MTKVTDKNSLGWVRSLNSAHLKTRCGICINVLTVGLLVLFNAGGSPLFAQTTPPTLSFTSPAGMQRGTTATFLVEGTGLAGASEIVFSEPGLTAKILEVNAVPESRLALETKLTGVVKSYFQDPVKMQARVEIKAEAWMATGTHLFRVITPRGSSTPGKLAVSALRK